MSFQIQIIEPTLPENEAQANIDIDRIIANHLHVDEKPSATLLKLYKILIKKYPCLSSYRDDDPKIDDCVWADGPLLNNFGHQAAVLSIASDEEQVMAFILQNAGEMNLTVVDPESGTTYRPNSQGALEFMAQQAEVAKNNANWNKKAAIEYVLKKISPIFLAEGYKWVKSKSIFIRKTDSGFQDVWLHFWERQKQIRISFIASVSIDSVTELKRLILKDVNAKASFDSHSMYFNDHQRDYRADSFDNLAGATQELLGVISEKVIPFLCNATSIYFLDGKVNTTTAQNCCLDDRMEMNALILGYLANPSNFNTMVEFYREKVKNWPSKYSEDIEKVERYVEQNNIAK